MAGICTDEWCNATEHVLGEIGNTLFTISEHRWFSKEDSYWIKSLKRRLYDIHVNYRGVFENAA